MNAAKIWWKATWRLMRVTRREQRKAHMDLLRYGTGIVMYPKDGSDPRHVPLSEVRA